MWFYHFAFIRRATNYRFVYILIPSLFSSLFISLSISLFVFLWTQPAMAQYNHELRSQLDRTHLADSIHGDIDFSFTTFQFEEGVDSATGTGISINPELTYDLTSWGRIKTDLTLRVISDRTQYRFTRSTDAFGIGYKEIVAEIEAINGLKAQVGAISQRFVKNDLLINDDQAHPGVRLSYEGQWDQHRLELIGERVIPTSDSLETERREKEETPSLEVISLSADLFTNSWVRPSVTLSTYEFSDLPSIVAYESNLYGGNSILSEGDKSSSEFLYNFRGYSVAGFVCFCYFKDFSMGVGLTRLENQEAPEAFNRGQIISVGAELRLGDLHIIPEYVSFFNESDTSPAFYNESWFGHNNRQGELYRLIVRFANLGFRFKAETSRADVINPNQNQNEQKVYRFMIMTNAFEI